LNPRRVVITGGPGTGKTSVIEKLEKLGFFCFHEIIRSMTLGAKKEGNSEQIISNPLAFVSDPKLFNQKLLEGRIAQFHMASDMDIPIVFYDRGIPDVLAYMNYFKQSFGDSFINSCMAYKYDDVLLLPPWEAIYISDNERLESFKEAMEINGHLEAVYKNCGYQPKSVPEGTVEERITFILNELIPQK
jgi:predicted ATPase